MKMKVTIELDEDVDGIEAVHNVLKFRELSSDLNTAYNLARTELKYGQNTVETLIEALEKIKEVTWQH